jgi:MoaA/NifB/PqqE/SkfB family radical SAM enzyme
LSTTITKLNEHDKVRYLKHVAKLEVLSLRNDVEQGEAESALFAYDKLMLELVASYELWDEPAFEICRYTGIIYLD